MISVTFERQGHANWPFLLQVDVVGDGPATTNIKINTKWLWLKTHFIPIAKILNMLNDVFDATFAV
jgi:hypothetical protein